MIVLTNTLVGTMWKSLLEEIEMNSDYIRKTQVIDILLNKMSEDNQITMITSIIRIAMLPSIDTTKMCDTRTDAKE